MSEYYDTRALPAGLPFSKVPKSSNPAVLYRDYFEAVDPWDAHDSHILRQKTSLKARAAEWLAAGEITDLQMAEIVTLVDREEPEIWKPLLYVIPRTPSIDSRLTTVPPAKRAGLGPELIIPDLTEQEFDVIEFLA